jgi:hypothetical protein
LRKRNQSVKAQHQVWGPTPEEDPNSLPSVKDDLGLKPPSVYSVPCECGQFYIGQTGRPNETSVKEHQRHIRLEYPHKSDMADHSINRGHRVQLQNTTILSNKSRYMDWMVKDAIEIELQASIMNREDGLCLSRSWKPHSLKGRRKPPIQK